MIDHLRDKNGSCLYNLSKIFVFPAFVKQANIQEKDYLELPSDAFADPVNRLYPLNSPADTWLSAVYFSKYGSCDVPEHHKQVARRLAEAASLWNIELPKQAADIKELARKVEGPELKVDEAMEQLETDEEKEQLLAELRKKEARIHVKYKIGDEQYADAWVESPEDFRKIADDLLAHRAKYPYEMRRDVARQLLSAPPPLRASMTAPMEVLLNKTAGYGVATVADVMETLRCRAVLYRRQHSDCPQFVEKLAEIKDDIAASAHEGFISPGVLDKTAALIDAMDRLAHLHDRWDRDLEPPENLFRFTGKDADDFRKHAVMLANGRFVSRKDVLNTNVQGFLGDYLDEKTASYDELFEKLPELTPRQADNVVEYIEDTKAA